jgi:hypothetical protein
MPLLLSQACVLPNTGLLSYSGGKATKIIESIKHAVERVLKSNFGINQYRGVSQEIFNTK